MQLQRRTNAVHVDRLRTVRRSMGAGQMCVQRAHQALLQRMQHVQRNANCRIFSFFYMFCIAARAVAACLACRWRALKRNARLATATGSRASVWQHNRSATKNATREIGLCWLFFLTLHSCECDAAGNATGACSKVNCGECDGKWVNGKCVKDDPKVCYKECNTYNTPNPTVAKVFCLVARVKAFLVFRSRALNANVSLAMASGSRANASPTRRSNIATKNATGSFFWSARFSP